MGDGGIGQVWALISNWIAFISSCLSFITFAFRVIGNSNTHLDWCNNFFDDSCNRGSWRGTTFSFAPSVFVDAWTPFVFGFIGVFLHIKSESFKVKFLLQNWIVFFVFHFLMSMFGNLGYANGVGIIIGSICLVGNLFQFVAIFICKDYPPGLDLEAKCSAQCRKGGGPDMLALVTSWIGFVAACLVATVGLGRVIASGAHLDWCNKFVDDACNKWDWRMLLFTFVPDEFVDAWQPTVFAAIGILIHLRMSKEGNKTSKVAVFCKDWMRYFLFNLTMALFGCIGYVNGWGILCSIVVFVAALLSLICWFICEKPPPLDLDVKFSGSLKGSGANVST